MTTACKSLVLLLCLAMTWSVAQAQDDDEPPMPRERVQQRIEDVRKMKLIDILQLHDEQVEKFFAAYNPLQKTVLSTHKAINDVSEDLHRAVRNDEANLQPRVDALTNAVKAHHAAIEKRNHDLKPVLSDKQYAAYLVFEAKFVEELSRLLLKRAKNKPPRGE